MVREYKDVIRIEVDENCLESQLRNKQLGFERFTSSSGADLVRLGYKDEDGNMRYFSQDHDAHTGYWLPGAGGGIFYGGNVAVGGGPNQSSRIRFESRNGDSGADFQIRVARAEAHYADIGFMSSGMFKIDVRNQTRDYIYVGTGVFGIVSAGHSKITQDQSNGILVESINRDVKVSAGERIKFESRYGDFVFRKTNNDGSEDKDICRLYYDGENDEIRIHRNYGQEHISLSHQGFCINAFASKIECRNNEEMLVENHSGNIRLKPSMFNGNVVLQPGATGWVEAQHLLKLPLGTQDPEYKDGMNGSMYINTALSCIRLCLNGSWQTILSWGTS